MSELESRHATILSLEGDLEPHDWEQLRDSIIDAARPGTTSIVLDLSQVTFFDSHSIHALLGAHRELEPRGVTIHLGPCSRMVQMVVDISGIDQVFTAW